MRQPPDWLNQADERILEYLNEEGGGTPGVLAEVLDYTPEYIGQRLGTLTEAGLAERPGRGLYRITERGEQFLAGEFDASDFDPDGE